MKVNISEVTSKHRNRSTEQHHSWRVTAKFIETEGLERETVETAIQEAVENLGDSE